MLKNYCYITECEFGLYGTNCKSDCGKCKNGSACDRDHGTCYDGCQTWWTDTKCDTYIGEFIFYYWMHVSNFYNNNNNNNNKSIAQVKRSYNYFAFQGIVL